MKEEIAQLSLKTTMALFNKKIVPILAYGIDIIWDKLKLKDLAALEKVKARFLKKALGVSKYTRSRLLYELAKETFLVEGLRINLLLPSPESATKLLEERKKKREEIWQDFYATDTMLNRNWTKANQELRHVVTRLA
jgi:hypothetical protein